MSEARCINCVGARRSACDGVFNIAQTTIGQATELSINLIRRYPGDQVVADAVMEKQAQNVAEFTIYLSERLGTLGCALNPEEINERLAQGQA